MVTDPNDSIPAAFFLAAEHIRQRGEASVCDKEGNRRPEQRVKIGGNQGAKYNQDAGTCSRRKQCDQPHAAQYHGEVARQAGPAPIGAKESNCTLSKACDCPEQQELRGGNGEYIVAELIGRKQASIDGHRDK